MIPSEIIQACKRGDMLMFREMVMRASPYAYSLAFRLLGDEDLSKDAVQDSMIKVWKKLDGFDAGNNFKTWLYRIVVNTCLDYLRKQKRNREMKVDGYGWEQVSERLNGSLDAQMDNREMAALIRRLTSRLSPAQKTIFILSELMGFSQDDISEILEVRKSGVKANLFHARRSIEKLLEKYT